MLNQIIEHENKKDKIQKLSETSGKYVKYCFDFCNSIMDDIGPSYIFSCEILA